MGALHIEAQEGEQQQQQQARTAALFEGPERRCKKPQPGQVGPAKLTLLYGRCCYVRPN